MPKMTFRFLNFVNLILLLFPIIKYSVVANKQAVEDSCANLRYNGTYLFFTRFQDLAVSPPLLRQLAQKEEIIYSAVRNYFQHLNQSVLLNNECQFYTIQRYLKHFEATTGSIKHRYMQPGETKSDRPTNVAWNPIGVYHLFNRLRKLLPQFLAALEESDRQSALRNEILGAFDDIGWPSENDLRLATSAILRIQHVYDLPTADIANGWLDGEDTGLILTAWDCDAIGQQALTDGEEMLALEWFQVALRKLSSSTATGRIMPIDETSIRIKEDLCAALYDSDFGTRNIWDAHSAFRTSLAANKPIERKRWWIPMIEATKGRAEQEYVMYNYWGVCSSKIQQTEAVKAQLFCYLETKSHPLWTIGPLKVELLALQPLLIVQYHSLIGEKTIQNLQNEVRPSLTRSSVVGKNDSTEVTDGRTSVQSWIDDTARIEFNHISKIIEAVTGLHVRHKSSAEFLQVASYSSGSHYAVHKDAGIPERDSSPQRGDRIATFLFYLADVVKGGGTAFPYSQVLATPERGSAVFWYNLSRNGSIDMSSYHGACPVVLGEKWIANKWIRVNDQMFLTEYTCRREPDAKFGITVNGRQISDFF